MISNRRKVETGGPDFYPTPAWATEALMELEDISGSIWEPACGNGAISKILESKGLKVRSSDLNDHGYGEHPIDFLKVQENSDIIITNPPFNIAESFFHHGYSFADKKLILLLRLAFLESSSRYESIFSKTPPSRVWVFSQRLSMYPEGSPVKGGGTTSYGWFVWDKTESNTFSSILKWIPPGYKPKSRMRREHGQSI